MPRLPVLNPTAILSPVMTTAARTELPAAVRFSARINSDEGMAGVPAMQELSPLRDKSAKQIAASVWSVLERKQDSSGNKLPGHSSETYGREQMRLVLGFDARHFFYFLTYQS